MISYLKPRPQEALHWWDQGDQAVTWHSPTCTSSTVVTMD